MLHGSWSRSFAALLSRLWQAAPAARDNQTARGREPVRALARSFNGHAATISRLAA